MLQRYPELRKIPMVAGWAGFGRPVMVRRHVAADPAGCLPAALPLPPAQGKRRLSFSFPPDAHIIWWPPVLLRDVPHLVPAEWRPVISALLALGREIGTPPRVFGAALWEYATGLAYLSATSDLDLLWQVADEQAATHLVATLRRIDADGPVQLDGELELPDGAGVNWRELCADNLQDSVLAKTVDGVELRRRVGLFDAPVLQS